MEQNQQKQNKENSISKVVITDQTYIVMNGITKVLTSTENTISALIGSQSICVDGEKLSVTKLDLQNKILEANGNILAIKYSKQKQKENFLKRIFG